MLSGKHQIMRGLQIHPELRAGAECTSQEQRRLGGYRSAPPAELIDATQRHADARGQRWADLMRRTFGFDVLACPRGGGRLRLIALIAEAALIARILGQLGVPTAIPAPRPARATSRARRRALTEPR